MEVCYAEVLNGAWLQSGYHFSLITAVSFLAVWGAASFTAFADSTDVLRFRANLGKVVDEPSLIKNIDELLILTRRQDVAMPDSINLLAKHSHAVIPHRQHEEALILGEKPFIQFLSETILFCRDQPNLLPVWPTLDCRELFCGFLLNVGVR